MEDSVNVELRHVVYREVSSKSLRSLVRFSPHEHGLQSRQGDQEKRIVGAISCVAVGVGNDNFPRWRPEPNQCDYGSGFTDPA